MKVLVTGSRGFIGRHLVPALAAAGHHVVRGISSERTTPEDAAERIVVDFSRDVEVELWRPRMIGIDCVVNTVGVMASGSELAAIHTDTPKALFAAAAERGAQVIQVSALGADPKSETAFLRTKGAADDALLASHPFATVVMPSLVYGEGGASAGLFVVMATLPLIPLPGRGGQSIQPIHIDDVIESIVRLVGNAMYAGRKIALVGPAPLTLRQFLAGLRAALGLPRARFVPIPMAIVRMAVHLAGGFGNRLASPDPLRMLVTGNTSAAAATIELLGRSPRPVSQFVAPGKRRAIVREAKLVWLLGLMRIAVAIVWLVAGVVSAGLYPIADSLALVSRMGVTGMPAVGVLYAGVVVDLAFGIATLVVRRKALWALQILVVLGYTAIITIWLPEFWLHPYGPIVKNLPFLCALLFLYELEERSAWST